MCVPIPIFIQTVRSVGEASRKSRSWGVGSTSGEVVNWKVVRFGKAKWFKYGAPSECKMNFSRLTAPLKRERGGVRLRDVLVKLNHMDL